MLQPGSDRQIFRKMQLGVYGDREWNQWLDSRGIQGNLQEQQRKGIKIKYHSVEEYLNDLAQEAVCGGGFSIPRWSGRNGHIFSIENQLDSNVVTNLLRMKSDNDRKLPQ